MWTCFGVIRGTFSATGLPNYTEPRMVRLALANCILNNTQGLEILGEVSVKNAVTYVTPPVLHLSGDFVANFQIYPVQSFVIRGKSKEFVAENIAYYYKHLIESSIKGGFRDYLIEDVRVDTLGVQKG